MSPIQKPTFEEQKKAPIEGGVITIGNEYREARADFFEYLSAPYEGQTDFTLSQNQEILDRYLPGVLNAKSVHPDFFRIAPRFSNEDWEYIRGGGNPVMRLMTVTNYYRSSFYESMRWGLSTEIVAQLASLPLVYQTTLERLEQIFASGEVLSDRAFSEMLVRDGYSANKQEEYQKFSTNTYGEDREIGLDNYVFATFGKPYSEKTYGSISVLFKPDALEHDDRTFATRDDYLDLVSTDSESLYRKEVLQGLYFYKSVAEFVQSNGQGVPSFLRNDTDRRNQYGATVFSTWEVKAPKLSTTDIDKIIFSDIEDLRAFQRKHGSNIPLVYRPNDVFMRGIVMKELGLTERAMASYQAQDISNWCNQFFREHPERRTEYFGDVKPSFDASEIFRLSDAEDRVTRMGIQFVEEGKADRALKVPPSEQGVFYQKIDADLRSFVTPFADLKRLVSPAAPYSEPNLPVRYSNLEDARAKLWSAAEAKVILIHPVESEMIEINTTRLLVVRVRAPQNEIASGNVQHYEIDDVVELQEPPHFNKAWPTMVD